MSTFDSPQGPLELLYVASASLRQLNGQPPEPPCDSSLQQRTACTVVFSTVFSLAEHLLLFWPFWPQTRVRSVVASTVEGEAVGFSVGKYVGCRLVGESVWEITGVGLLDGISTVGLTEGGFVGSELGAFVRLFVGAFVVGELVGLPVGSFVGTGVGLALGAFEGELDGVDVGSFVGKLVG